MRKEKKTKPTLIIPLSLYWDNESNEILYYELNFKSILNKEQYVNVYDYRFSFNRVIVPSISAFKKEYLEAFEDIILRTNEEYYSMKDNLNEVVDGVIPSLDKFSKVDDYIENNGGIENIVKETIINVKDISNLLKLLCKTSNRLLGEMYITADRPHSDNKLPATIHVCEEYGESIDLNININLEINPKHINYVPLEIILDAEVIGGLEWEDL